MQNLFLKCSFVTLAVFFAGNLFAQPTFTDNLKTSGKVSAVFNRMEDSVKRQFEKQNLVWPPVEMYVRSFKYDRQLEIWVKSDSKEPFKLFKTYKVCMQSGTMGPKRMEGDYQVPEGFYYINEWDPLESTCRHASLSIL